MIITRKTLLIVFAIMMLALSLTAQSQVPKAVPEVARQTEVKSVLNLLLAEDYDAINFIFWDDFYLNDEDITYYYYDAVDYGDDDEFTREIVSEISGLLHYVGDTEDYYTDWYFDKTDTGDIIARSMNKSRAVNMIFYAPVDDHLYLREIIISNKE